MARVTVVCGALGHHRDPQHLGGHGVSGLEDISEHERHPVLAIEA
jgi:hypothetical protein